MYKKVLVIGAGNILLKDEGIGVHIAQELAKKELPGNVEVIDAGVATLYILASMKDVSKLIIIDALKYGKKPGTVYCIRNKELESSLNSQRLSLHQMGLLEALAIAKKTKTLPGEIVFIGIEPANIDWGLELTQELKQKTPSIINLILKEIPN